MVVTSTQWTGSNRCSATIVCYDFDDRMTDTAMGRRVFEQVVQFDTSVNPDDKTVHPVQVVQALESMAASLRRQHAAQTAHMLAQRDAENRITRM